MFGLQLVAVLAVALPGALGLLPGGFVTAVIVLVTVLAWLATRREWRPVRTLARAVNRLDAEAPDPGAFVLGRMPAEVDADVAALVRGLEGFAARLAGYNQRERNFTRDASHELRSPLTVIRMSADMLADEADLGEFATRSVRRIKSAAREMEALVDALLVLAREDDDSNQRFVVNEVLRHELEAAREKLDGLPVTLELEEVACFALDESPQAFAVLCWQLIRNACRQTEEGQVRISVLPGVLCVRNGLKPTADAEGVRRPSRHGFELAIAQRVCERYAWPLELETCSGIEQLACVRFPRPLPVSDLARE